MRSIQHILSWLMACLAMLAEACSSHPASLSPPSASPCFPTILTPPTLPTIVTVPTSPNKGGEPYYVLQDPVNFDVLALIDDGGEVVEQYSSGGWEPYGTVLVAETHGSRPPPISKIGHHGLFFDRHDRRVRRRDEPQLAHRRAERVRHRVLPLALVRVAHAQHAPLNSRNRRSLAKVRNPDVIARVSVALSSRRRFGSRSICNHAISSLGTS